jgi:hypothetical protein
LYFSLVTLAILFVSFGAFVWTHRVDLIASAITRSTPPYRATLGSVSFSKGTLTLKNLALRNENTTVHIKRITLTGPLSSWLSYLFLPNKTTLDLKKGVIYSPIPLSFHFKKGLPTIVLHLDHVFFGDQLSPAAEDFTGSIPEILTLTST